MSDARYSWRSATSPLGDAVDLAVSGGPDSLGLLLLALEAGLDVTVHHVDHHARPVERGTRSRARICDGVGVGFVRHDVAVEPGGNFEARARSARARAALPAGVLTGHTMDDLAETVLLNMLRGAGARRPVPDGDDPTKPLRDVRRRGAARLRRGRSGRRRAPRRDQRQSRASNRNRVRHELMAVLDDVAGRDVVPVLARQAATHARRAHVARRTWRATMKRSRSKTPTVACCERGRALDFDDGCGPSCAAPIEATEAIRRAPTKSNGPSTSWSGDGRRDRTERRASTVSTRSTPVVASSHNKYAGESMGSHSSDDFTARWAQHDLGEVVVSAKEVHDRVSSWGVRSPMTTPRVPRCWCAS